MPVKGRINMSEAKEQMISVGQAQAQLDKVVEIMGKKFVTYEVQLDALRETNSNLQALLRQQQEALDEARGPKTEEVIDVDVASESVSG
jgi:uncharacterized coiled-coil DUF342 family protein